MKPNNNTTLWELERALQLEHPNWPQAKARWLAAKILMLPT